MTTDDPLVRIHHVRAVGQAMRSDGKTWCASGIRAWCERHGIDYLALVHDGVPASIVAATDGWGEACAQAAIDEARGERGQQ